MKKLKKRPPSQNKWRIRGKEYKKKCIMCGIEIIFISYSKTPDYCQVCRMVSYKLAHKFANKKWYLKKKNDIINRAAQKGVEINESVGEEKKL